MIEVAFTSAFRRKLKRVIGKDAARRNRFKQALSKFIQDPFTDSLRTHKLSGKLTSHWSFTVEYDLRVIFRFVDTNKAVFEDLGTHKEVY
jgi:addiction module RelE/StbE family toxin